MNDIVDADFGEIVPNPIERIADALERIADCLERVNDEGCDCGCEDD